ncbi:MAG TPA: penicillin-binding protein 2 [Conexibacter sp.]|nr:penicillin-binding protein 2 [Conexibacter sp.]
MIQSPDDRRAPITPQLALRVAILGGIALALFGIVFFRLWFLQVLSGDQYVAQARGNRVRDVMIPAQRGEMLDRNGKVLVGSRPASVVVVSPPQLPPQGPARRRLYVRLSHVLELPTRPQACRIGHDRKRLMEVDCLVQKGVFLLPYADVTIKTDVSQAISGYLAERAQEFPGVAVESIYLRSYPYREVGAQLFGTVGQISAQALHDPHFRGVKGGTLVGTGGLEYTYDHYLRGVDGATRVQVDALGQAKGKLQQRNPIPGNDVKLSLDLGLERAGQAALRTGIALANGIGNPARAGAFVALDPRNGEVLAMGSEPSFDPTILTRPLSDAEYKAKLQDAADFPQVNRAIGSAYPVGSTFKIVTAAAALATGIITPSTPYTDNGEFKEGAIVRHNAGGASYGTVTLRDAIRLSVDTFFYNLGQQLNADPASHPDGGALQTWARKLGLGATPTGIDIGGEIGGTVPTPRWRDERNRLQARCEHAYAVNPKRARRRYSAGCVFADGTNRPWSEGDNTNLAVGQGDFLATPLQMAVAYAAIENGGTVVKPHVGLQVTDHAGRVLQKIDPKPARHVKIPYLYAIQDGLHAAASEQGGTSADVFAGFPAQYPVFGKTGTAQRGGDRADQSWYVAYVPDPVHPIVVACTIESGGFGAQAAAPAVRLILSQWFGVKKEIKTGSSRTL